MVASRTFTSKTSTQKDAAIERLRQELRRDFATTFVAINEAVAEAVAEVSAITGGISPALTIKGNNTGAPAATADLTVAQTTAMLNIFSAALRGLVPPPGAPTGLFLRDDASWAAAGGGTAFTLTIIEVDLGATPVFSGSFNITGAGLTVGRPVLVQQIAGPYTGKGTRQDEAEMDLVAATGYVVSAVLITVHWHVATPGPVAGNIRFGYAVSA